MLHLVLLGGLAKLEVRRHIASHRERFPGLGEHYAVLELRVVDAGTERCGELVEEAGEQRVQVVVDSFGDGLGNVISSPPTRSFG